MNISGMKFGSWLVLKRAPNTTPRHARWHCLCECGCNERRIVQEGNLRSGHSKSCGKAKRLKDLTGMKFGRLRVTDRAPSRKKFTRWNAVCDCGNLSTVNAQDLTRPPANGHNPTRSCGCLSKDLKVLQTRHGHAKFQRKKRGCKYLVATRTYRCWVQLKCQANKGLISLSDRWNTFENFLLDMGECPQGHQFHRHDYKLSYFPDNCFWLREHRPRRRKSFVPIAPQDMEFNILGPGHVMAEDMDGS
jgi:hypothetical protein